MTHRYQPAIDALQAWLAARETDPKVCITVHTFDDDNGGVRIAEIDWVIRTPAYTSGSSCMRSDPESAHILLCAEDFLLTYGIEPYRPKGWDSDIDEHGDAVGRLEFALDHRLAPIPKESA